ncbi:MULTISPECIES: NAD(P)-dependent oxidoreductase [unclassified Pseudonocardia]|uniref:NAD(P)-dependent oxidoreductase n=1 Tax=Pseudonocardia sp. Ae707_Ps1 TaxID=1885572 RepID=UPI000524E9C3|nr:NAD(P)-dependent oxidoreductase [Pseudonocardia sp. Ae707_Ps1]OLM16360.1 3-hydroxyisobutyrate dehydrogenase [Pseudonocardia sp. Ae707_Ps1]
MTSVALLGTGIMGAGMGHNVLAAGLELRVWNRTSSKAQPLADAGATLCEDPADAVRGADVVVTMLGDAGDVTAVMERAAGGLTEGQVWLQTTTVGVEPFDGLRPIAERHGLVLLDAPVLGTRAPAESGQLVIFVAGDPSVRATVDPVLDAVGRQTVWVADTNATAAASRLKLVANSWVLAITAATGESVALAQGLGVDPQAFLDSVAGGPLDLPYLQNKAAAIVADDWTPNFTVDNAAKDAGLIVEAAEGAGVRLDVAEAVRERLRRASGRGHGGDDMAAAYKAS